MTFPNTNTSMASSYSWLYEVKSRIIVAMDIVPANESDHNYFLPMIKQGIHNCGKGRIKLIIADRGFLDGSQLWELKHKLGINFIIPAKAGMTGMMQLLCGKSMKKKQMQNGSMGKVLAEDMV